MTFDTSDEQLLNKVCFVKWKDAVQAIHDYIRKRLDELNKTIEEHKVKCTGEIILEIGMFKPRVGMELTLEEFERYVKLHKQLRDTMLGIRSTCLKVHDEINTTLNDCMKLIDLRSPLYSKFMEPAKEERDVKSPIFIMAFVALIFLSSLVVTSFLIMENEEWESVKKSLKVYKMFN